MKRKILYSLLAVIGLIILGIGSYFMLGFSISSYKSGFDRKNIQGGPYVTINDSTYRIHYAHKTENQFTDSLIVLPIDSIQDITCFNASKDIQFNISLNHNIHQPSVQYQRPQKIAIISDIEGNFYSLKKLLMEMQVMDTNHQWIFGNGHLVFNGDMVDRGIHVNEVLWLIYQLEQSAIQQGGMVHYVLGNHEIMNFQHNFSYTSHKYHALANLFQFQCSNYLGDETFLGRWMRSKNTILKLGDLLFVHGGISQEVGDLNLSLEEMNEIIKSNYNTPKILLRQGSAAHTLADNHGPFWYRGYFRDDSLEESDINSTLSKFNANRVIVGHTVSKNVSTWHNDKVISTDVKHPNDSKNYFPERLGQGLLINGSEFYRVYKNGKVKLILAE